MEADEVGSEMRRRGKWCSARGKEKRRVSWEKGSGGDTSGSGERGG